LPSRLEPARVGQLAVWWRKRIKELRAQLSPALADDQARKQLRETLVEEIQESTLDTEVGRVVRAANKSKVSKAGKTRKTKSARAKSRR
jgi:hypothetical protein